MATFPLPVDKMQSATMTQQNISDDAKISATGGGDECKRVKIEHYTNVLPQEQDHQCECLCEMYKGFTEKPVEDTKVEKLMQEYFKVQTAQEALEVVALHTSETESNFMSAVLLARNATHVVCISCMAALHSDTVCSADVRGDFIVQKILLTQWGMQFWAKHAQEHWGFTTDGFMIIRGKKGQNRLCKVVDAASSFQGMPLWTMVEKDGEKHLSLMNPVQYIAKHNIRHRVSALMFDPQKAPGFASNDFFNLFDGWGCEPKAPQEGNKPCQKIMHHLLQYVCGGDQVALNRLLTVWALKYQRPNQKLRCTTVFRGEQGAGKSILMQIHSRICGPYLSETADLQQVIGRFNGHLQTLLWIVLDEAMFPGDKKAVALLKRFATAKDMTYERKFKDIGPPQPFLTDVMMTTNEAWAIPFDTLDRRYLVFDVELPEEDIRKQYMSELRVAIEGDDEVPEFFHLLLNWEIPAGFDINNEIQTMPNNVAKAEQALQGYDGTLCKFMCEHLQENKWFLGDGCLSIYSQKVTKEQFCRAMKSEIYDKPENLAMRTHGKCKVGQVMVDFTGDVKPNRMTRNLNAMFGDGTVKCKGDYYVFPSLKVARSNFAIHTLKCPEYFDSKKEENDEEEEEKEDA